MSASPEPLRIFFLDVGQGDCTFIVPPKSECAPILFDCADLYVAERFVANHEITDLAAVVASHFDLDHIRGMHSFLKTHFEAGRRVQRLVMFPDRVPKTGRNGALRKLMEAALTWEREPPHAGFVLKASHRDGDGPLLLGEGEGWRVELVLPWVGAAGTALVEGGDDPNASSAVLRVTRGGTSVLIGGDAPLGSWERLEPSLRGARAIRTPHHGGEIRHGAQQWQEFTDLYDAVGAELSVISVGTGNGHGHPLPAHAEAAQRGQACRLLCTQMTPQCHDDLAALRDEALGYATGVEFPYRHKGMPGHQKSRLQEEVPCAGSIIAWIDAEGNMEVEPTRAQDHDRLLERVDHPLCVLQR